MIEPYVSLLSYPVYKLLHPSESVNLRAKTFDSKRYHLLEANIAMPTIFFKKEKREFEKNYPALKIIYESYHTIFLFFVAGGYSYPALIPNFVVPLVLRLERLLSPFAKWLGSMMTVVVEKVTPAST
jgi:hypothetical protein